MTSADASEKTAATDPTTDPAGAIREGRTSLGIELGSTRIKAALVDERGELLAAGSHTWENAYVDDNWTYPLEAVWEGLRSCYEDLARDVRQRWATELATVGGLGVSAMMHGYLPVDAQGELLVPFRTWRNTYTTEAAARLTQAFGQNVPLRWSVSHLLHAVLGGEEHVDRIAGITTLAGYVHRKLTGRWVLGVGDASGVFPIGPDGTYDAGMLREFARLEGVRDVPWDLPDLLPQVLSAGEDAGTLTEEGARLLDPEGTLRPGIRTAPPEGDAGTGMVATNSVRPRTGNVSAGTSAFAMVVLERPLSQVREEIDLVTTPSGDPVAMIHTNNCTGDLDAWLRVFGEFAQMAGASIERDELYRMLFEHALEGRADGGGILAYNYLSGEHQTGVPSGRPLMVRTQQADFTLANLMRTQLYAAFGALASGMRVLAGEEVAVDALFGHGGIFTTQGVAQQVLADALDTPVSVSRSAGEGGAWGMALLAGYAARCAEAPGAGRSRHPSLSEHLQERIFADVDLVTVRPDPEGVRGYDAWLQRYRTGLDLERLAGDLLD